uniref:Uncharacterized protein n=1 Tax=Rhizophora mucronata TaxID=61149 RepID=A0A2P2PQC3_RHIMU
MCREPNDKRIMVKVFVESEGTHPPLSIGLS